MGFALYKQGNTADAAKSFKTAAFRNPGSSKYFYQLGKVLERLGNKPEAIDAYKAAVRIDRDFSDARLALEKLEPRK